MSKQKSIDGCSLEAVNARATNYVHKRSLCFLHQFFKIFE